jgi:hypothetical protein
VSEPAILLSVERLMQPDDLTCGPTALLQLYRYYGHRPSLAEVIAETRRNPDGGTMAVFLGLSALAAGFQPALYSYNLRVFDPTWWALEPPALIEKLRRRARFVRSERRRQVLRAYVELLQAGGKVRFHELEKRLLVGLLRDGQPILTGLSATYLYRTPREYREQYDDVRGEPAGHFVVISGYDPAGEAFLVCDPSRHSPFSPDGTYAVGVERLIASILMGEATGDAVLLVLGGPRREAAPVDAPRSATAARGA